MSKDDKKQSDKSNSQEQQLETGVAKSTQPDNRADADDIKKAVAVVAHESTSDKQKEDAHSLLTDTANDAKNAEKFAAAKPNKVVKE